MSDISPTDAAPHTLETAETQAPTRREKFSRWLGFGVRQTLFCFMTDIIDPWVGENFQKRLDPGGTVHNFLHNGRPDSYRQKLLQGSFGFLTRKGAPEEARQEALRDELAGKGDLKDWLKGEKNAQADGVGEKIFQQGYSGADQKKKGFSLTQQVWWGEVIGDLSAIPVYLTIKTLFEKPIDRLIDRMQRRHDAEYEHRGRKDMAAWAKEHNVSPDDPRYKKRLEEFKRYQAESYVDSAIIASGATVTNVIVQKAIFQNERPWLVVLGGKLLGAVATFSVMWGFNRALPRTAQTLDEEADRRFFSKIVHKTQKLFGMEHETKEAHRELDHKIEQAPLPAFTLTPEERSRLHAKPKAGFRERNFAAQVSESPAQMSI